MWYQEVDYQRNLIRKNEVQKNELLERVVIENEIQENVVIDEDKIKYNLDNIFLFEYKNI